MEKVKIRVTRTDIKSGMARKSTQCPIALAIKRKTGADEVVVGTQEIWINDNMVSVHPRNKRKIRDFILAFDEGRYTKSFEFTMSVPVP